MQGLSSSSSSSFCYTSSQAQLQHFQERQRYQEKEHVLAEAKQRHPTGTELFKWALWLLPVRTETGTKRSTGYIQFCWGYLLKEHTWKRTSQFKSPPESRPAPPHRVPSGPGYHPSLEWLWRLQTLWGNYWAVSAHCYWTLSFVLTLADHCLLQAQLLIIY